MSHQRNDIPTHSHNIANQVHNTANWTYNIANHNMHYPVISCAFILVYKTHRQTMSGFKSVRYKFVKKVFYWQLLCKGKSEAFNSLKMFKHRFVCLWIEIEAKKEEETIIYVCGTDVQK